MSEKVLFSILKAMPFVLAQENEPASDSPEVPKARSFEELVRATEERLTRFYISVILTGGANNCSVGSF